MHEIEIRVCGDRWVNPGELDELLSQPPGFAYLVVDIGSEGPSLGRLGIVDRLTEWCHDHSYDPKNIYLKNWSNSSEAVPFSRMNRFRISHFFWMSQTYWSDITVTNPEPWRLAFFVGRKTFARARMLYDVFHALGSHSLLSSMIADVPAPWQRPPLGIDLEDQQEWFGDVANIVPWLDSDPIPSLDHSRVSDQYRGDRNTNRSLLQHYKDFHVELIAESYTLGDTFFPTEKTVRPLMAQKPFLLYGPRHFLKNLRQLGFQTYGDFWDESYDDHEGVKRWHLIFEQLQNICALDHDQYQVLLSGLQAPAKHNRSHLESMITDYRPQ